MYLKSNFLLLLVAVCLLAGCAAHRPPSLVPELILTPDERMVIRVADRCYQVTKIDYAGKADSGDDLAYASLVAVTCPVARGSR